MNKLIKMNWNTLLITMIFPIFGFAGKELYKEVRSTHDAVMIMRLQMLPRSEFDIQMSELRTRISAVEVDIQRLKNERRQ